MTIDNKMISDLDIAMLRRAIALADKARTLGEFPFGAVIANEDGTAIVETTSTEISSGDCTCHAEISAVRLSGARIPRHQLQAATIFASAEPCAMCSTAIFYCGIRRIIFGLSKEKLQPLLVRDRNTAGLEYSCREILAYAAEPVEVHGPCLEIEAILPHDRFCSTR